jgi:hypothetical protein
MIDWSIDWLLFGLMVFNATFNNNTPAIPFDSNPISETILFVNEFI